MKRDNNRANIIHIPYASRFEIVLCVSLACFNIALASVLISIFPGQAVLPAILVTLGYLVEVALIAFRRGSKAESVAKKNIHTLLSEDGSIVFKNTTSPVVAFNSLGTILWYNDAMRETLDSYENYVAKNITSLFGISPDDVCGEDVIVNLDKSVYKMEGFAVSDKGDGLYIAMLTDITELRETERKYLDEKVAVAYIAIDNVEDVLQYVHDKYADAVTRTEEKLRYWAASMNGIIKPYDKDKYIMLFDSVYLDKCIENRFSILDEINRVKKHYIVVFIIGLNNTVH